jgi:formate/nitrite transporter FocA (FNT family)
MVADGILRAGLPDASWTDLVSALGYSTGFVFVTMARQQLFTETTLTVVLPVLHRTHGLSDVIRYWSIVFLANVLGTLLFAAAATIHGLFPSDVAHQFVLLGMKAVEPGFLGVLVKGVFAGWLIALMVWLMPASAGSRFFVIVAVTWLIGAAKFSHVVAGSAETAFAAMQGSIEWRDYLLSFLAPALIGNSVGGVVFVALLNHAQVRAEV